MQTKEVATIFGSMFNLWCTTFHLISTKVNYFIPGITHFKPKNFNFQKTKFTMTSIYNIKYNHYWFLQLVLMQLQILTGKKENTINLCSFMLVKKKRATKKIKNTTINFSYANKLMVKS